MTCLVLLAAGIGFSAAEDENVVYTRERAFRIPLQLSDAERKDAAWIRLMVSTDAGKTWNRVREESPKRPTVTFPRQATVIIGCALAVIGHDEKMHPADLKDLKPGLKVIIDSAKPEVALEAVKTRSGLRGVRWTTKDESPEGKMTLKCAIWDENVKAWKPRSLDEARNSTIWFGRNEVINKMQLLVVDAVGNEAVEQIDVDGDRFLCGGQEMFALASKAPSPGQFADNAKKRIESRASAESSQMGHRATEVAGLPAIPKTEVKETKGALVEAFSPPKSTIVSTTVAKPTGPVQQVSAKAEPPAVEHAVAEEWASKPVSTPVETAAATKGSAKSETVVAAKPATKAPAANPEVDVTYSNRRTTVLHYEMSSVPKGQAVELWGLKEGKEWICLRRDEDGASPMETLFPDDGRWGVILVVGDASGSGRPNQEDAPAMWVEIDTTRPKVEIRSTSFEKDRIRLQWRAVDANLVEDSVRILFSRDVQGPWETIAVQQKCDGDYLWKATEDAAAKPIYFKFDATDRAGNIGSATSAQPLQKGLEPAGKATTAAVVPTPKNANHPESSPAKEE